MKHTDASARTHGDTRFERLLSKPAWKRLPKAVRARFGKRLGPGTSVIYQGRVVQMRLSRTGWVLAQAARLIGGPLPYDQSCLNRPAIVAVTEDTGSDGQFWIRQYARANGFPQVVHSSKRFAGPTGLEEYVGHGIGMALTVRAEADAIHFVSDHYFLMLGGRRLRLPRWLAPGRLVITHRHLDDHSFLFSLDLTSRLLGPLIQQDALFHDVKE